MTDEELVMKYKTTSDQKWLVSLFSRYLHLIYGVCLRYSPFPQEAEDFTHGIYERLVDKVKEHEIKTFKSWLFVLTKNYCLEQIRRYSGKRHLEYRSEIMQSDELVHLNDDVQEEKLVKMEKCIEKLNIHQKRCIKLFYYHNNSYAEIASSLNQDIGMIRSHLQNGRRNLKICMESQ